MSEPLLIIWNKHQSAGFHPPTVSNEAGNRYLGYFENRFCEQWLFSYDHKTKLGELRGGDIDWDKRVVVRDGKAEGLILGNAEALWLLACWQAATGES